ncbi:hypothetical protein PHYPSEUDO_007943 [Phytophthora pseudosyringae]|uniref:BZIP domain-containing protein n=1 Tax=Phytophthora pseudosyringae TaxID=221518 RepID=A0A8T1WE06_9STRA|nr:hypothetical protein PHYPSEUDO_007943 [Phytophthora pseudosyringae]
MHRRRAPAASRLDLPAADDACVLQLERELRCLAPAARFRLGGQPRPQLWDVMMRGLTRPDPRPAPATHRPQALPLPEDEQEHDDDDESGHDDLSVLAKRSKTNSERGRAFRARRKKYEDDLATIVSSLRQEVTDLGFLRSVRADNALRSRNSMGGSLVRLAREYFALFERGMPSVRGVGQKRPALLMDGSVDSTGDTFEMKQKAFLESAMDPGLQFGEASGPQVLLDQWRRYTTYHSSINVEVVGVEVSGEEDNPMVTVRSDVHVVFSRDTFDHVFPHVADNEELVKKFVGREVVYHGVNRFQFSAKGQILIYDSDVGFVDALVQAGANVSDIALLMQQARIADECRLGDEDDNNGRIQELEQDNQDEMLSPEDDSSAVTTNNVADAVSAADTPASSKYNNCSRSEAAQGRSPEPSRLAIDFLLS